MNKLNSTYTKTSIDNLVDYQNLVRAKNNFKSESDKISAAIHRELKLMVSATTNYSRDTKGDDIENAVNIIESMLKLYSGHDDDIILTEYVYHHFFLCEENCSPSDFCKPFMDFIPSAKVKMRQKLDVLRMIDDSICSLEDDLFVD